MAADIVILFLCIVLTVFVFFLLERPVMQMNHLLPYFAINILLSFLSLTVSGAYDVFWRYLNMRDYITCSLGVENGQVLRTDVVKLVRGQVEKG